jgi:hypothetical protein
VNQSTLRYVGLLQAAIAVGFVVTFEFVRLADPLVAGILLAAGAILTAGSVESVAVGSVELSWRGWYAAGLCLVGGGVVTTALGPLRAAGELTGEASVFLVTQSVVALSVVGYAWLVVRRPAALDLTENVDRRIQIPR